MSYQKLSRNQIAERVAQDIPDGAYVNLGIGLPTKIASYLPSDKDVFLHSENGLLAFGPPPEKGQEDPELINAGKEYVTMQQGGSFFHHGDSFAMMRGGHLDIAVLGAFQVAANVTIAQVSEVVELGGLDPEHIITPGIYVKHVVQVQPEPVAV